VNIEQYCRILEIIHEHRSMLDNEDGRYGIGTGALCRMMRRDDRYIMPMLRRLKRFRLVIQDRSSKKGKRMPWRPTELCLRIMKVKVDLDKALDSTRDLNKVSMGELDRLPRVNQLSNEQIDTALFHVVWTELNMQISSKYLILRKQMKDNALAKDVLSFFKTRQGEQLEEIFDQSSAPLTSSQLLDRSSYIIDRIGSHFFDGIPKNIEIRNAMVDLAISLLGLLEVNEKTCSELEKDILFWYHHNPNSKAAREMIERFLTAAKKMIPQLVIPRDLSKYRINFNVEPYKILCEDPSDPYFQRVKQLRGRTD
jgi:hypothetical protein